MLPAGFVQHEQVITVTAHKQKGLGAAARAWFETHHLPVLKDQKVVEDLRYLFRMSLIEQSATKVEASTVTDPDRKRSMDRQVRYSSRRNSAVSGTVGATTSYLLEDQSGKPKMSSMRERSPERLVKDVEDVFAGREERKRMEKKRKRKSFGEGLTNAESGGTPNPPSKKRKKDFEAYHAGFQVGEQNYQTEYQAGEDAARNCPGNAKPTARNQLKAGHSDGFIAGFDNFWNLREQAYNMGYDDGQQRRKLNYGQLPIVPRWRDQLLTDYMDGYNGD